jgi:CheY-like chemotaxis protein
MTMAMVVDDEGTFRRAIVRVLRRGGFEVCEAADGAAGLAALDARPTVALALIDYVMPGMGGLEVIARLRRDPRFDRTKLVLVTGLCDGCAELSRVAGVDVVLLKPFGERDLLDVLARLGFARPAPLEAAAV